MMREAGLVVAAALAAMRDAVAPGVSTAELDAIAERVIRDAGAAPSFKNYQGFPASICSSVNEQVVHGIPSHRQILSEGDLISLDCGAVRHGWHGDAAITVPVGEVDPGLLRLTAVAEDALWAGITAAALGVRSGRGRLSDISSAVERGVREAAGRRFGIVTEYGGHGIGTEMHQDPHVPNHGRSGRGPRLVPGLALAIEPMLTMGSPKTVELADGWTVATLDGSVAVHVEHTIALLPDGVWVLTAPDGGRDRLGDLIPAQTPVVSPKR